MILTDLAEVLIPKIIKSEEGQEVLVISQNDFSLSGYTRECGKLVRVEETIISKNLLKEYDVLLSRNGEVFRVAIVGKITQKLLASETLYILRVKDKDKLQENAINLYMYLKSDKGQLELAERTKKSTRKIINQKNLLALDLTTSSENIAQRVENFQKEQKQYSDISDALIEIHKIHQTFDDKNLSETLGTCKMCRKVPATHLRIDTNQPFKKGIPMCDKCSSNIMF